MKQKTVRELGGEIWAEVNHRVLNKSDEFSQLNGLDVNTVHQFCDLVMGVLARHEGSTIAADEGMQVPPLANSDDSK